MKSRLLRLPAAALSLLLAPTLLSAAPPSRIATISGSARTELPHAVSGRAQKATDLGEAPSGRVLDSVTLHFSLTTAQQTALTQLLIDQQNPSSPRYHQWLTPEQFGAQFGMSSSDLAKTTQWLSSQGLTVSPLAPSSNLVSFSGTVAQVEQALGTSIHTVSLNGEQHIANVTNPHLPSGLAAVVSGVTGLSDFRLKPRIHKVAVKTAAANPNFTSSISGANFLAPGDLATIYDTNALLTASINGTGITIAVMGQTDISLTDIAAFRAAAGLTANNPTVVVPAGEIDPGTVAADVDEAQLDTEWSGATAPNATVLFVNSTDVLNNSLVDAIDGKVKTSAGVVPPIISISYGLCEQDADLSSLNSLNVSFQEANTQGQTIVGPGGDSGATDCDYQTNVAADGLAVDFPASSPFVTGVGGTTFSEGAGNYWTAATGGTDVINSALSYIPEVVWNDSSASGGLSSGGGGLSSYFSKPAWQVGTGVPNDFSRDVPDVAFTASPNHDPYLICSSGSCVSGFRDASSNLNTVGGTSASTPVFAGILALVEQKINARIGNANPIIYGLANSTYASTVFHDVTSGNNESSCIAGSPNCPSGGPIGYSAGVGYDLASGWGSVNAFNLANSWLLATPAGGTSTTGSTLSTTTVTSSAVSCGISSGSIALTVQVANGVSQSGQTAVPGGSVQILVDNVAVGTAIVLSNGSVAYSLNTTALTSGGHTVSASYSGDPNYAGSKGTLSIDVVSATQPDFSVTPCTASVTIGAGGTTTGTTYTVTAFNGFTGSVAFSVSADASLAATANFSVTPVVISSGSSTGTTQLTLTASQTTTGAIRNGTHQQLKSSGSGVASRRTFYSAGSGVAIASLLLLTLPRRRRWAALLAAVVSVSIMGALGCGSSSGTLLSGGGSGTGTVTTQAAPGTYNVTVTGIATTSSGTTLVHSAVLQFVVQ